MAAAGAGGFVIKTEMENRQTEGRTDEPHSIQLLLVEIKVTVDRHNIRKICVFPAAAVAVMTKASHDVSTVSFR